MLTPNVGLASMSKYLKEIIDSPQAAVTSDKSTFVRQAFEAYWQACAEVGEKMFEDPRSYTIQKAIGADVMMRMWKFVVEWTNQNNTKGEQNLRKASSYTKALKIIFYIHIICLVYLVRSLHQLLL